MNAYKQGGIMKIKVCELFQSIQGEGNLQGMPSIILRLTGCNLNCKWCDTQILLKDKKGIEYTDDMLLKVLESYHCSHVIITGGEPTIHADLNDLIKRIRDNGYYVTVETNATNRMDLDCDLVSMSPKLSNSVRYTEQDEGIISRYNNKRININAIQHYIRNNNYQIKFVCRGLQSDIDEVKEILKHIGEYDSTKVMIMPLADSREQLYFVQKELIRLCVKNNLRYANRLQLQVWNNEKEV